MLRLEAKSYSKLEALACSRGIGIDEALHNLIDVGISHLQQQDVQIQTLSPKQIEVMKHLRVGLSVKEIANQMGVKEETVRTHIHRVRGILDCSDLLSLRFNNVNGDAPADRNDSAPKIPNS